MIILVGFFCLWLSMTRVWNHQYFEDDDPRQVWFFQFLLFRDCANVTIAPDYVRVGWSELRNKHWYTFFIKITIERDDIL
jgi:hypothetical protein